MAVLPARHDAPPAAGRSRLRRAWAWWARHPTLAAVVLYAALSLLMVGQGLLPGRTLSSSDFLFSDVPWLSHRPADVRGLGTNFELADAVEVFQPFMRYTRAVLPHLPLWNPHISGGRPYLANAQSAIFSPFNWPSFILSFWKSLALVAALKLWVAALAAYGLGRVLGMRFGGALLTGIAFAFGTFFVVWLAWPLTAIFPLIPLLWLLAELLVRRPGPLPAAGLAVAVALTFFGGHPETTFHALVMTALWFAFRLVLAARARAPGGRGVGPSVLAFVAAYAVGTAVAAVMVVPFAELLVHSADLSRRAATSPDHLPAKYLLALFLHDYWGRPTQSDIAVFLQLRAWYPGALTLLLGATALILRPAAERVGVAVGAVGVGMVVVGAPPVFQIVTALPGFSSAHNGRMVIYVLLGLALLAGWGLDDLCARTAPSRGRRRVVLAAGAALLVFPVLVMAAAGTLTGTGLAHALDVAWGFAKEPVVGPAQAGSVGAGIIRMSSLLQWLPLAGIGLALIAWRLRSRRPLPVTLFAAAAVLLLTVDLFRANMGFNPAIRTRDAAPPTTPAIRYLQRHTPERFVGVGKELAFQPLPADLAMDFGLYDARGYDYPAEKRYDALWRRNVAPGVPDLAQPIELATATPAALRALDLLSVRELVDHPLARPLRRAGLSVGYRGDDAVVYDNANALPKVFVVDRQQVVKGGRAALAAATAPGFDRRHVVVTEHRLAGLGQAGQAQVARVEPAGTARLTDYGAERVRAQASSPRGGLLVLTDIAFPGWKASVDGRDVPIHRVDYLLRGVPVPAGRHTVELRYAPASFRAGWILSLLGLVAVAAALVVGLRRRRASGP